MGRGKRGMQGTGLGMSKDMEMRNHYRQCAVPHSQTRGRKGVRHESWAGPRGTAAKELGG